MMSSSKLLFVATIATFAPFLVAGSDPYRVVSDNGAFTINSVTMSTPSGKWTPRSVAQVEVKGVSNKVIKAGTVQYQMWESGMRQFTDSANFEYFKCTNKGCDPATPVALALDSPGSSTSNFTLRFQFQMQAAQATGDYSLVFFGQDQDHYPYDFSATIYFNLSSTPALAAPLVRSDPYSVTAQPGNFTVEKVTMAATGNNSHWKANAQATVTVTGTLLKNVNAGVLKWQVYESYQSSFVAQGFTNYFVCNNKGCDTSKPLALALATPSQPKGSKYTLTFSFNMPAATSISKDFKLLFHGEDQDHIPYDFSATIAYSLL